MTGIRVEITGRRELTRALNRVEKDIGKALTVELRDAADEVAKEARRAVPSRSGRAAKSIRSVGTKLRVAVVGGRKSVPYYGWLEFGSRNPRLGRSRRVGPWVGSGSGPPKGRFLIPAAGRVMPRVRRRIEDAIRIARRQAGF